MTGLQLTGREESLGLNFGFGFQITVPVAPDKWAIEITDGWDESGIVIPLSSYQYSGVSVNHTQAQQEFWVSNQTERLVTIERQYTFQSVLTADMELFRELVNYNKGRVYRIESDLYWYFGYLTSNTITRTNSCGGEISFVFVQTDSQLKPDESAF